MNIDHSKSFYRSFFEHSMEAALLTAPDGAIFAANPAACKLFGRTEEEICKVGRSGLVDMSSPQLSSALSERAHTGMARAELIFIRGDGTRFPGEVSSKQFTDELGKVRTVLVVRDLTEHKLADDRIKASEEKFRKAFMTGADAFYLATFHEGKILEANESFKDVFGYTREEAIGKTSIELGLYADPIDRQKWVSEMETTGQIKNLKLRCNKKGGIPITVLLSVSLLEKGDEQLILGVVKDITEQTQAQEALRESEAYRRAIFESARDAILIMRGECFIDCNPSALMLYGADRESLVGHVPYEFSPEFQPDGRPSRESALEKIGAALNGVAQFFDWKHQRLDGTPFDAEVGLNRLDFGKEVFIQAIVRDVSERKHAEEALRENELKYRALFETADDAILLFTGEQWVDCNAAALRIYGCTREQIIGAHPSRFSPPVQPDGQPSGELAFKRISLAYANEPQAFEWVHCRADGTLFDAEVHLNRVDLGGKPYIQAMVRDVSSRKRAEVALKKSEERFQLSMEATSDGLWDWNAVTNEVYYSPACYHMLGYEVGDFSGTLKGWQELLHPDDIEHTMRVNMDCVEGRREIFSVEYRLKAKNGEWRWILGRGKSIARDLQGRSLRLVGTNSDVTERKQMEIALTETQAQIQAVMNSTEDMIWAVDPVRCGLLTFNQGLKKYFKERLNVDCQIGMTPEELLPPAFAAQWHDIYARALLEGSFVMEYLTSSGVNVWMLTVNVMKRGEEVFGISVFSKDITEIKQAQTRILKLSRLYDTLSQVNTTIVHSTNREDLFHNICKGVIEHGKFLMAWVGLVDEATHRVKPVCHDGAEQGYLTNIFISVDDIPEGRGPTGTSIRENRVCYINNFLTDERIRPWSEAASKRGFQSSVGLPLRLKGKVIGALTMYTGDPDFFDAEQLALMNEMSADISFALDNIAREAERMAAEEKIVTYLKQLEGAMQGTLLAVSNMVEQRDPYTAGHERRVGLIAADIAREIGWSDDKCSSLQKIGLVHDIGKISVPAEILSKPTRLTVLEFEIIKTHAEKGYEILKDVEFPLPIAEIIHQHHERMDGSGYPRGLKGDEILPEARILAVADVLESMASHRPYRPALGIDAGLKEIEDHRSTWFDATVVDAILTLVRKKGYRVPD